MERNNKVVDGRLINWHSVGSRHVGDVDAADIGLLSWRMPRTVSVRSHATGNLKEFGLVATKQLDVDVVSHLYKSWDGIELEVWSD